MGRNETVDFVDFAVGIEALVGDIPPAVSDEVSKAVAKSVRKAAKSLREEKTEGIGANPQLKPWSDRYRKGFSSRVDKSDMVTTGTVGNKTKPGLVHLLEKGHMTLTERRTRAFPHMAPAFDDMQDDFVKEATKAIGRAVS